MDTLPDYTVQKPKHHSEYVQVTTENLRKAWSLAKHNILKNRQRGARYYNAKRTNDFRGFEIGDLVWLRFYGRANKDRGEAHKLMVRWHGPFLILDKIGEPVARMYRIDTTAHPKLSQWQSINELKKYHPPSAGDEPIPAPANKEPRLATPSLLPDRGEGAQNVEDSVEDSDELSEGVSSAGAADGSEDSERTLMLI